MMIAGIADVAGAALATRNVRDFTGLPIAIENPWQVV
jgi:predicted nucleic acid-binding protein